MRRTGIDVAWSIGRTARTLLSIRVVGMALGAALVAICRVAFAGEPTPLFSLSPEHEVALPPGDLSGGDYSRQSVIPATDSVSHPTSIRHRTAKLDLDGLQALRDSDSGAPTGLNLFANASFRLVAPRFDATTAGYSLSADLDGIPLGTVTLVVNGEVVVGSVHTAREVYTIRSIGEGGLVQIRQLHPAAMAFEEPHASSPARANAPPRGSGGGVASVGGEEDEETIVDVLVVWTSETEEEAGSREHLVATVDHLAAHANKAFADSGVRVRLNIPHMQQVDTEDDGSQSVWLSVTGRESDLDTRNVAAVIDGLRNKVGADLVHFLASGHPCTGLANVPTSTEGTENRHMSTSKYVCTSNVFAHEIGHNFGLRHDRFSVDPASQKVAPYSHGYTNQAVFEPGATASSAWYTIMAYSDQCMQSLFPCHHLPRFSNPDQDYLGDPLGVPGEEETYTLDGPADARRTLNEMRSVIAGYRDPRPNLSVSARVEKPALGRSESFALTAEIANRGRSEAAETVLVAYLSTDSEFSNEDQEAGRLAVPAVGASMAVSHALELTAPADPGAYWYFACVDDAVAAIPCYSVPVTVGPTVSIADAEATEGESLRFPVNLSATFPIDIDVNYSVLRETAVDGIDFDTSSDTLSIPAGEDIAWIEVATLDDAVAEPRDTLRVALSSSHPIVPEGPVVAADAGIAEGTIVDDDGQFAMPDFQLRTAVLQALGKERGENLSAEDMAGLTELVAENVTDFTGLEFATGLLSLRIPGLRGANISALGHLPDLRSLDMVHWQGGDLGPLRGLESLRSLDLEFAAVEDLSPLSGLVELRRLNLVGRHWIDGCTRRGRISNIAPLSGLVRLVDLNLSCNRVADLTPLSAMSKLIVLDVAGNDVDDLSGLENLVGLRKLELAGNPLSDLSPIRGLSKLQTLVLNSAAVSDLSPLAGMTSIVILELANNGELAHLAALESLTNIIILDLSGNEIADLAAIPPLRSLRVLHLEGNRISNLTPLTAFPRLTSLYLDNNRIQDISALSGVVLQKLSLRGNRIEDIAPLSKIVPTYLVSLWLDNNAISDIEPLAKLTRLQELSLAGNSIVDIGPLAGLTELTELDLSGNLVHDLASLTGLRRLGSLNLGNNLVKDVSALADTPQLPALRTLYLYGNPLSAESATRQLPRLGDSGVAVFTAVAVAMDASAMEGDDAEAVVRLTEPASESVRLSWTVLGESASEFRKVVSVESTADAGDFETAGACGTGYLEGCRQVTIPAGTTESSTFIRMLDDKRQEPHELFVIELSGTTSALPPGVSLPHERPGRRGSRISQAVGLIVDPAGPSHAVPLFPAAGDSMRQGFMRIVNLGGRSAVHVEAFDRDGASWPTTLSIRRGQTRHFNSQDLESGNFAKGLSRGIGAGSDDWRLRLWSNDIRALAYIRTADGFLTSMHDRIAEGPDGTWQVPIFNPASNTDQVSRLRLVNEGDTLANIEISGLDDAGNPGGVVRLSLAGGSSRTITAQELESGQGLDGALGNGRGKWRLAIASNAPLAVANLLESPTGHLTNLSTMPANRVVNEDGTTHHIPYFPSAADPTGRKGFARVINRGDNDAAVRIHAYDDSGPGYADALTVPGGAVVQFNSDDLEIGHADKGLEGIGAGSGDWRLELESDADLDVLAYIRHQDGFLTGMHDVAPAIADGEYEVPTFNPGSNSDQASRLLLANAGDEDASVTITGVDDRGLSHGEVSLEVQARRTLTLSAGDLESGSEATTGRLGDGNGKWRLIVTSDRPLWVMSLLESRSGHLTNLSTVPERSDD